MIYETTGFMKIQWINIIKNYYQQKSIKGESLAILVTFALNGV